jgi:methylthioribose-1-phosphate isomerase
MPAVFRLVPPDAIEILDQTRLPQEERVLRLDDINAICEAIAHLRVRGAPLLGLMGAAALALAASSAGPDDANLQHSARVVASTRPTAADLGFRVQEALTLALAAPQTERAQILWQHAARLQQQRINEDAALSALGARLISPGDAILTHCNTGELATGGMGTALGVIAEAWRQGNLSRCYMTETRPLLQGARLTAWEALRAGIPATLLPDTAAGSLLASGAVQAVITGADRVAANGDTANKIGTYQLAAMAARHNVPFYIAAPVSTIDADCPGGAAIPIEMRDPREIGGFGESRWSPDGIEAYNPAFDVTPAGLIAAIVTEGGIVRPPFGPGIAQLLKEHQVT